MTSLLTEAPSLVPPYESSLYCSGTLIREATGFDNCLASSAAWSSCARAGMASARAAIARESIHSQRFIFNDSLSLVRLIGSELDLDALGFRHGLDRVEGFRAVPGRVR